VTEERKFAILFAATLLAARKLIDMDPNKPNMAKGYFVDRAIDDAAFILERIDARIACDGEFVFCGTDLDSSLSSETVPATCATRARGNSG